jgi:hypothetical protein
MDRVGLYVLTRDEGEGGMLRMETTRITLFSHMEKKSKAILHKGW